MRSAWLWVCVRFFAPCSLPGLWTIPSANKESWKKVKTWRSSFSLGGPIPIDSKLNWRLLPTNKVRKCFALTNSNSNFCGGVGHLPYVMLSFADGVDGLLLLPCCYWIFWFFFFHFASKYFWLSCKCVVALLSVLQMWLPCPQWSFNNFRLKERWQ